MRTGGEHRRLLIAFACACAAHAAMVAWMSRKASPPLAAAVNRGLLAPTPAPLIVRTPPEPLPREPEPTPIGEATGDGDSIARLDLPDVMRSPDPRPIDQAWTRQQPSLTLPPQSSPPADQPATLGPTSPSADLRPPPAARQEESDAGTIAAIPAEQVVPNEPSPPRESPTDEQASTTPPAPSSPPAAPEQPANPGEVGQSDLDPFARAEGVDFKQGGIEARTGRPVKLVRPRVDLGFMADATAMSGRRVTILLQIETDAEGKPTRVDIVKSSGSRQIDDAIRMAMYSSWFGGKMPDSFPFGITLWR